MRWIEIIRLRTHPEKERLVAGLLRDAVKDMRGIEGLLRVDFYSRTSVPTDFSLHLSWNGPAVDGRGSMVGLNVAENLKTFGLLDHSVWVQGATTEGRKQVSDIKL